MTQRKAKEIAMPCCIINLRIRFIATSLIKKWSLKKNNKGWEKECDRMNYYSSCQLSSKSPLLSNLSTNCKLWSLQIFPILMTADIILRIKKNYSMLKFLPVYDKNWQLTYDAVSKSQKIPTSICSGHTFGMRCHSTGNNPFGVPNWTELSQDEHCL